MTQRATTPPSLGEHAEEHDDNRTGGGGEMKNEARGGARDGAQGQGIQTRPCHGQSNTGQVGDGGTHQRQGPARTCPSSCYERRAGAGNTAEA